jgi:DNA-binding response OmpR family regulator
LVVERHDYFRDLVIEALTPGCSVKIAADMDEARAMLSCGVIDLLILDLTLDGTEGSPELLRSLRPKPCPILIFTSCDESEMDGSTWDELHLAGADDLVVKGMSAGESLARKAAALLDLSLDEEGHIG